MYGDDYNFIKYTWWMRLSCALIYEANYILICVNTNTERTYESRGNLSTFFDLNSINTARHNLLMNGKKCISYYRVSNENHNGCISSKWVYNVVWHMIYEADFSIRIEGIKDTNKIFN